MGGSKSSSGPSALQKQRIGLQNQLGQQLYGTGQQIFATEFPTLGGLLNSPMSPQERAAIFETAMAPQASAFDAARENAAQRAARTRNPAGLLETDEQLAREGGQAQSDAAMRAQFESMNVLDQRRQEALQGLAQLYGIDLGELGRLMGGIPETPTSSGFSFKL